MSDPTTPGDANPSRNPAGDGVNLSGRSAAQGRSGTRTFTILVISLVLIVVVFAAIFGLHAGPFSKKPAGGSGQQGADNQAQAQQFNTSADYARQAPPPQAVDASRGS